MIRCFYQRWNLQCQLLPINWNQGKKLWIKSMPEVCNRINTKMIKFLNSWIPSQIWSFFDGQIPLFGVINTLAWDLISYMTIQSRVRHVTWILLRWQGHFSKNFVLWVVFETGTSRAVGTLKDSKMFYVLWGLPKTYQKSLVEKN